MLLYPCLGLQFFHGPADHLAGGPQFLGNLAVGELQGIGVPQTDLFLQVIIQPFIHPVKQHPVKVIEQLGVALVVLPEKEGVDIRVTPGPLQHLIYGQQKGRGCLFGNGRNGARLIVQPGCK